METRHYIVKKFDELTEGQQQKVLEKYCDINVDHEWWESEYDDAANILLKITGFGLDRDKGCTGEFIEYAEDTAKKILEDHGQACDTYATAVGYYDEMRALWERLPEKLDADGYDDNEYDREQAEADIDGEFLRSILEDYASILQRQFEYLTTEEAIRETLTDNDYDFTEAGQID
jgi:hypothetical protein